MWTFLLVVLCGLLSFVSKTSKAAELATLFAFGTLGFWGVIVTASIGVLLALEHDEELSAALSVLAMLLVMQLYTGFGIVGFILYNPVYIFWIGVLYLALGVSWSLFKWFVYCRDARKKFDERSYAKSGVSDLNLWKPNAQDNKARITGWMVFWPWSSLWFLINDPIRRAFSSLFDYLQGIFQRISDKAFEGADA